MWSKGVFFCCLSFLVLPSLAHKYLTRYREDQDPISRLRMLGVL